MTKEGESYQPSLDYLLRLKQAEQQPAPVTNHQVAREAMFNLLGELAPTVRTILERMEIAEEEIQKAQAAYPYKADEIWRSFTYLRPTPLLDPCTPHLYRAHAREIVTRIAQAEGILPKKDLEVATDAELCCVFCAASQAFPLHGDAVAAYQRVFKSVFPDATFLDEFARAESYPGRAEEIITELRNKYRQKRD